MTVRLWNTRQLALDLAGDQITYRQKVLYLVVSSGIWSAAGYLGAFIVRTSSGWMYWYEALMVLIVTVAGLYRCSDQYEGAPQDRFIEAVVVLGVPLSIKLILFTWAAYLAYGPARDWLLSGIELTQDSPFKLIEFAIVVADSFYRFLVPTVGVLIYYLRLGTHLRTIAVESRAG